MKKSLIASSLLSLSLFSSIAYPKTVEEAQAPVVVQQAKAAPTASEIAAVLPGLWSVDSSNAGKTDSLSTFVIRQTSSTFQFCPQHEVSKIFSIEEKPSIIFGETNAKSVGASFMMYQDSLMFVWLMFDELKDFSIPENILLKDEEGIQGVNIEGSYVMSLDKNEQGQWVLKLDGDHKGECGEGLPCVILTKLADEAPVMPAPVVPAPSDETAPAA